MASEDSCREAAVWDGDLDDDRSDDADDNDGADQGKSILSPEIVAMKMGTITAIKATLISRFLALNLYTGSKQIACSFLTTVINYAVRHTQTLL